MHHRLVDRVCRLVREDASRQARHQLLHLVDAAALHNVVVDQNVFAEEFHFVLEVAEQTANLSTGESREMDDFKRGVRFLQTHAPDRLRIVQKNMEREKKRNEAPPKITCRMEQTTRIILDSALVRHTLAAPSSSYPRTRDS